MPEAADRGKEEEAAQLDAGNQPWENLWNSKAERKLLQFEKKHVTELLFRIEETLSKLQS